MDYTKILYDTPPIDLFEINNREILKIESVLKNNLIKGWINGNSLFDRRLFFKKDDKSKKIEHHLNIVKGKDDYFYVEYIQYHYFRNKSVTSSRISNRELFKCDQLNGLLNCLKMINKQFVNNINESKFESFELVQKRDNCVQLTEKDILKINNILYKYFDFRDKRYKQSTFLHGMSLLITKNEPSTEKAIEIHKNNDDYFYVSLASFIYKRAPGGQRIKGCNFTRVFKCDQLDGFKKLFNFLIKESLFKDFFN